jgi:hypothetical protein
MRKMFLLVAIAFMATSCQRSCSKMSRDWQSSDRDYTIVMYSGGDTVFFDQFRGIVNDSKGSDGIYYFKGDQLIEVSGDYVVTSR